MDSEVKVATGYISAVKDNEKLIQTQVTPTDKLELKTQDIYQILRKKGYDYTGEFQCIHSANKSLTKAKIYWRNNWVTLIDGILQLNALRYPYNFIIDLICLRKLTIDVNDTAFLNDKEFVTAQFSDIYDITRCGGIAVEGVKYCKRPILHAKSNILGSKFIPFFDSREIKIDTILFVYSQIVAENRNQTVINVLELCQFNAHKSSLRSIFESFNKLPIIQINFFCVDKKEIFENQNGCLNNIDLLLASNLSSDHELCQALQRNLCCNTFLINKEVNGQGLLITPRIGYHVVGAHHANGMNFELVRWNPILEEETESKFLLKSSSGLASLASTVAKLPENQKLTIVSSYPPIDGLKNTVQSMRKTHPKIYLVVTNESAENKYKMDQEIDRNLTFTLLLNGQHGGEFYVPLEPKECTVERKPMNFTLLCSRPGDFNYLHWGEMDHLTYQGVEVTVHYAGVNHIDVQKCLGFMVLDESENKFGTDFSGLTKSGDRVMGLVKTGALSSIVYAQSDLLWPVPECWSLEDAATVPLAYCIAFYCLGIRYTLLPGMSVFVHGGAGALGQAVISIALGNKCKVFTTVSDVTKRRFLRERFPELQDYQIGNSRDQTFGDMISIATNGEGCNIVISCAKNDYKNITSKCVANFGVMIDLDLAISNNTFTYGMYNLTGDISYSVINFLGFLRNSNKEIRKLHLILSEGIKRGYVKPLVRVVYPPNKISCAFQLLATSRHCGRALIQLHAADKKGVAAELEPRLHCTSNMSHLILCNNSFYGLRIAERLVQRGATKLYLHFLKQSAYFHYEIRSLKKNGVQIKHSSIELKGKQDILTLVKDCMNLGQIEGVYVVRLNGQSFSNTIDIVKELDMSTRISCPHLKYFGILTDHKDKDIQVCLSRVQKNLPATILILSPQESMGNFSPTRRRKFDEQSSVNSFELALRASDTVLIAYTELQDYTILTEEDIIAGIKINEASDKTIKDLKIKSNNSRTFQNFSRILSKIDFSEDEIERMTIRRLKEINNGVIEVAFKKTQGLATFFSYVDPDELLATTDAVFLPTQIYKSTLRDDEFNREDTYLCIIPGLEGHHERFRILCERLKIPAIVLQPGQEQPRETIAELAKRYTKILSKKIELRRHFYLLGYESGTLVALEMAALLEEQGLVGTVFFVGESPEKFQLTLERELKMYSSEEDLHIAIAIHMCELMVGSQMHGLKDELNKMIHWPKKVKKCIDLILPKVSHSVQYASGLIECAYGRIVEVKSYQLLPRILQSKLILINAASSAGSFDNSLQRLSTQPVSVYQLRAPLAYSALDLRCTSIINSHLSDELIAEFDSRNLCHTYLLNADTFMAVDSKM